MSSLNHVVVRCPPLQELGHPRVAANRRWRTVTTQSPAHVAPLLCTLHSGLHRVPLGPKVVG